MEKILQQFQLDLMAKCGSDDSATVRQHVSQLSAMAGVVGELRNIFTTESLTT